MVVFIQLGDYKMQTQTYILTNRNAIGKNNAWKEQIMKFLPDNGHEVKLYKTDDSSDKIFFDPNCEESLYVSQWELKNCFIPAPHDIVWDGQTELSVDNIINGLFDYKVRVINTFYSKHTLLIVLEHVEDSQIRHVLSYNYILDFFKDKKKDDLFKKYEDIIKTTDSLFTSEQAFNIMYELIEKELNK